MDLVSKIHMRMSILSEDARVYKVEIILDRNRS